MASSEVEILDDYLFKYKGYVFIRDEVQPEYIDSLENFEIRDSDVFLVTYPKSGTVWTQNIVTMLYESELPPAPPTSDTTFQRMPWLEYIQKDQDIINRPSPRLFASHLGHYLMPQGVKDKQIKVIYVSRNPKDVLVSYYHFAKIMAKLETPKDFDDMLDRFEEGRVICGSWFDHVCGWYNHRDDFNILFLTYEEMIKDLRAAVVKISQFLGKTLDAATIDHVVEKATFGNMKSDPRANYDFLPEDVMDKRQGAFLRKGTVGDWKNTFTVAQSERFDQIFREKMKGLPVQYSWDISEIKQA
ncbi:amine sulfotransferase [Amia ocellicauda]|uniref:amine sulfotransferase n=1 Tax=Amia ocellicauda TaxID=2972642 RepID=UPI003463EC0A